MSGKDATLNEENCLPVKDGTISATSSMTEDNLVDNKKFSYTESDSCLLEKYATGNGDSTLEDETRNLKSNKNDENTLPEKGEDARTKICTVEDGVFGKHGTVSDEKEKYKKSTNSGGKALGGESEEYKSVDRSDCEAHSSCGTLARKKNIRDNSLNVPDVDRAPTRTRRNTRYNLSKDVIAEHSTMDIIETTKSLQNRKLSPISRTLRSKSLDPPVAEHISVDAKPTGTADAVASRTKRALTPEVASRTKRALTPEVASRAKRAITPEVASRTKRAITPEDASRTKRAQAPEVASRTKRAQAPEVASRTKRAQAPEVASRTKRAQAPEVASRTKRAQAPEVASRTKRAQAPEDASRTKRAQAPEDASRTKRAQAPEDASRTKRAQAPEDASWTKRAQTPEVASRPNRTQALEVELKTVAVRSSPRKSSKPNISYREESRKTPSVLNSRSKISNFKASSPSSSVTLPRDTSLLKETLNDNNKLKIDEKIKDNSTASEENEIVNIKSNTTEKKSIVKNKRLPYAESNNENSSLEDATVNDNEYGYLENLEMENEMMVEALSENNRIEIEEPVNIESSSENGDSLHDPNTSSDTDSIIENENISNDQPKDSLHEKEAVNIESRLLDENKISGKGETVILLDAERKDKSLLGKDKTVNGDNTLQEKDEAENIKNSMSGKNETGSAFSGKGDTLCETSNLSDKDATVQEQNLSHAQEKDSFHEKMAVNVESALLEENMRKGETVNNEYLLDAELKDKSLFEKDKTANGESTLKEKETVNVKNKSEKYKTVNGQYTLTGKDETENIKNGMLEKDESVKDDSTLREKDEIVNVKNSILEKDESVKGNSTLQEKDETVNIKNNMSRKNETTNVESALSEKGDTLCETSSLSEKDAIVQEQNLSHAQAKNSLHEKEAVNVESALLEENILRKGETVNNEYLLNAELKDKSLLKKDKTANSDSTLKEKEETVNVKNDKSEKHKTVNGQYTLTEKDETENIKNSILEKDESVKGDSTLREKDETVNVKKSMLEKDESVKGNSTLQEQDDAVNVKNNVPGKKETINVESALPEKSDTLCETSSLSDKDVIVEEQNLSHAQPKHSLQEKEAVNVESPLLEGNILRKGETANEYLLDADLKDKSLLEKDKTVEGESTLKEKEDAINVKNGMSDKCETENGESILQEKDETVNVMNNKSEKDKTVNGQHTLTEKDETVNVKNSLLEKDESAKSDTTLQEKDETVNIKNMSKKNETINVENAQSEKGDTLCETSSLSDKDAIAQEQNLSHAQPKDSLFKKEAVNNENSILEEKDYRNSNACILEKDETGNNENVSDSKLDDKCVLEKDETLNVEISLQGEEETTNFKNMSAKKDKRKVESALSEKGEILNDTSSFSYRTTIVYNQNLDPQPNDSLFEKERVNDESALLDEKEILNVKSSTLDKDTVINENLLDAKLNNNVLEKVKAVYGESTLQEKDETLNGDSSLQEIDETANVKKNMLEKGETVNIVSALSEKDETLYDMSSLPESDGILKNKSITHTQPKTLFEKAVNNENALLEKNTFKVKSEKNEAIDENLLDAEPSDKSVLEKDKTKNGESTWRNKEALNANKNIPEKNETVNIDSASSEIGETLYEACILSDKDAIVQKQNLSPAQSKNSLFKNEAVNYQISLLEDKESLNSKSGNSEKEAQAKKENVLDAELHVKSVLEKEETVNSASTLHKKDEIVNAKNNMSEKYEKVNFESAFSEKDETLYETSRLSDKDDIEQEQNLSHAHTKNEKEAVNDESDLLEEKETLNAKSSISVNEEKVKNKNVLDAEMIDKGVLEKDIAMNGESTLQEKDETLNVKNNMSEINEAVNIEIALSEKSETLYEASSLLEKESTVQEQKLSHAQQKNSLFKIEPVNDASALLEEKESLNGRGTILEKDKPIHIENLPDAELKDKDMYMLEKTETESGGTLQENDKTVNFKNVSRKNGVVNVESALSEKSEILHDTSSLSDGDVIVQKENLKDAKKNDSLFAKEAINDESALLELKETVNDMKAIFEISFNKKLPDAELNDKNLSEKVKAVYGESTLQETDKTVDCKDNVSEEDETVNVESALQEEEEAVNVKNNMSENETINTESAWSKKCETLYDTSSLSDMDAILQNRNLYVQLNNEKEAVNDECVLLEKDTLNAKSSTLEKETVNHSLLDAGLNDKSELEKVTAICGGSTFQEKDEVINCKNNVSEKDETVNAESAWQDNAETVNVKNNISGKEMVIIESALSENSESLYDTSSLLDTDAKVQNPKFLHVKTRINMFENWAVNDESGFLEEKEIFHDEKYIQEKDETINENVLNVELDDKSVLERVEAMNVQSALHEKDEILNIKNNMLEKYTVDGENTLQDEIETVNVRKIMPEKKDVNSGSFLPVTINTINCMTEDEIVNKSNLANAEVDTYLLEKLKTVNSNSEDATIKVKSEKNDTENGENTFPAKGENASANISMMENQTENSKKLPDTGDVIFETVIDEKGSLTETHKKPANSCGKGDLGEILLKVDAVESEKYTSVDLSDSEEHADASSYGSSKRDNSLTVSEVDCAPTRSRRNIRHNLSKDVIPEDSIMRITENTKSFPDKKLSPISRSVRSKSLDPPALMSDNAKSTGSSEAASSRKKRAQTPVVKLKTEEQIAVRSSPRKAAKSIISYKEGSRRIPSVLISRPKMSSFKATSSNSSVAVKPSDTSLLKQALNDKNKLKIDEKIKSGSATSGNNILSTKRSDAEDGLFDTHKAVSSNEDSLIEKFTQAANSDSKALGNISTRKKKIPDNSLEVSEVDSAPTRTRRNIRHNISEDVIPEHSIMKITENTKSRTIDTRLKPISRSLRSKSLDPPELVSGDAKSTGSSEAASSRKKRAQTPEVKLKTEERIGVRSSPRKAAKSVCYKEDSRKTLSVPTKMSATSSNSGMDTGPSVATKGTKRGA